MTARTAELYTENGVQHEYSVPPPLVRKDLIAGMHKDAKEILPPPLLDAVMKIKQPFITPIYDFTAPAITFGRVAMVGDAAANARPHMGFGMAKAGTDAMALARHLDRLDHAVPAVRRRVMRDRHAVCSAVSSSPRSARWMRSEAGGRPALSTMPSRCRTTVLHSAMRRK